MMKISTPIKAIEEQTRRNIELFQNAMRLFTPFPPGGQQAAAPAETARGKDSEKARRAFGAEAADRGDAAQDRLDGLSPSATIFCSR